MGLPSFGRRNTGGGRRPPPPPSAEAPRLPWEPEHYIAGNLAIGNMRENLLARVSEDSGRVNAPILMIVTGAVAGYAAQHAALVEADARRRAGRALGQQDLVLAETRTGERYVLGDLVNHYLLEQAGVPPVPVMMKAAVQAGASLSRLPDPGSMMGHIARTMGGPEFGVLVGLEQHAPRDSVVPFLKLWPFVSEILRLEPPGQSGRPLPEAHWPAVIGLAATQFLEMAKGALAPDVAANLFLQSAMFCAKADPEAAEPGRWRLTPAGGVLSVERLHG